MTRVPPGQRTRLPTVVDGFIDAATCLQLRRELEFTWWSTSTVVNRDPLGGMVDFVSRTRLSQTARQRFFSDQMAPVVADIQNRVCERFALDSRRLEEWQALRYPVGGHFDEHHDGGLFAFESAGDRMTTVLLYLESPDLGGETVFSQLGLVVEPLEGRLLVWRNLTPDGRLDPAVRHRAAPVRRGRKVVLTTWERERPFPAQSPRPRDREGDRHGSGT